MMKNIYVIGSSNTDMVIKSNYIPRPSETVIGGDFFTFQGGKGANQAVAAAKLGGNVTFICKVGDDTFGKNSIEEYKKYDINTKYILKDIREHSGVAFIMVDRNGENSISVASGANSKLKKEDLYFLDKKLIQNDNCFVKSTLNSVKIIKKDYESPAQKLAVSA